MAAVNNAAWQIFSKEIKLPQFTHQEQLLVFSDYLEGVYTSHHIQLLICSFGKQPDLFGASLSNSTHCYSEQSQFRSVKN